jgi:hypothetical protein
LARDEEIRVVMKSQVVKDPTRKDDVWGTRLPETLKFLSIVSCRKDIVMNTAL